MQHKLAAHQHDAANMRTDVICYRVTRACHAKRARYGRPIGITECPQGRHAALIVHTKRSGTRGHVERVTLALRAVAVRLALDSCPSASRGIGYLKTVNMSYTVQVIAPHFCAGIVIADGYCAEAAPILRWCLRRDAYWLAAAFKRRQWATWVILE